MKFRYKYLLYLLLILFAALVVFYFWGSSSIYSGKPLSFIKKYNLDERFSSAGSGDRLLLSDTFKVMTYNIGYLSGMTNNLPVERTYSLFENNLQHVIEVFNHLNPDFIGFQEIDIRSARSYKVNQVDSIAKHCGYAFADISINWDMRYVPFPYWPPSAHFGSILSAQAILSRYPIKLSERIVFDKPQNNPFYYNTFYTERLAEIAIVETGRGGQLVIINVHLEAFKQNARVKQAGELLKIYRQFARDFPVVLIGDFNAIPPYPEIRETEAEELTITYFLQEPNVREAMLDMRLDIRDSSTYTSTSEHPEKKIDYIFYNKDKLRLINAFVVREAKTSSDHLPVIAEFVLITTEKIASP